MGYLLAVVLLFLSSSVFAADAGARQTVRLGAASADPISVDTPVAANWTSSGSNGTPSFTDEAIPLTVNSLSTAPAVGVPSSCLKVSQGTTGSQTNLIRSFGASPLDLSSTSYIDVLAYWPGRPLANNPTLYIDSTNGNFSNYFLATLNGSLTGAQKRGWNVYRILKSAFSTGAGSPTWSTITRLQFRLTATNGADSLYLCQINAAYRSRPKIMLTFDDGPISQFAAVQEANNAGVKMSINVVPALINSGGGSTYMSVANLQTLLAAGNSIQTHGWDHTSYINLADGGAEDLTKQRIWMVSNNLSSGNPGAMHHAFVQGESNSVVVDALRKAGVVTARGVRGTSYSAGPPERYEQTTSWDQENPSFGLADPYSLNCVALDNTTVTASAALVMVDKAISHGTTQCFYAHVLSASASDFSTANWTTLVNGVKFRIQQGWIDSVTQPQYESQMSGGRAF